MIKMKNVYRIALVVIALIYSFNVNAQAPKYSNEFLAIGVGAQAFGMSNSWIAGVDDVTSAYWNPAGLTLVESDMQLGLMHAEYFAGIAKYDYGALTRHIDENSSMAFSFIRFAVDDIPNTTELIDAQGNIDYDRITSFSAADYAFLISYARKSESIENLRYGANVKIIRRKVGDFAGAWGFGIDIGAQYDLGKWTFAAVSRDVTSTFNAWSFNLSDQMKEVFTITGNEIPENSLEITMPRLILGVNREFVISNSFTANAEVDFDITFDGKRNVLIKSDPISIDPHLGMQLGYKNFAFIRVGIGNLQNETDFEKGEILSFQPNIGIGINIKNKLTIDYALTDLGNQSIALYSNIFSLKFNINKSTGSGSQL